MRKLVTMHQFSRVQNLFFSKDASTDNHSRSQVYQCVNQEKKTTQNLLLYTIK